MSTRKLSDRSILRALGMLIVVTAGGGCAVAASSEKRDVRATVVGSQSSERAIAAMLDDWHDAAATADEMRYFGHLAPDSIFLGTDATERWQKSAFLDFARPHFAKGKAWTFRSIRRSIVVDEGGALAHFDEDLETEKLGPARGSGVVALRNTGWTILQYNLALTIPNDRFGETHEAVSAALLASDKGPLDSLAWLSGSWVSDASAERTEELWSAPEGGTMLGVARTVKAGKTAFFESMRIEARTSGVVLVARPSGQAEAEFSLSSPLTPESKKAVFENPSHDFPKRITYEKVGDHLVARIDGGGPETQWTYQRAVISVR